MALQRGLNFLDIEAFDHVADLHVFVVLERHAALEAVLDFADFVLEAAQRLQRALVDDHVVAQQADLGATLDHAVRDHAAGDVAGLGDAEDLAHLACLALFRGRAGRVYNAVDDTDGVEEYMLLCRMLFIQTVEDVGNKSILFIYIL